ncbi:response regulator transcription factor [Paenibacillus sp. HB172176]|uniref:response regulator transcription factor n=1 Tax=Paenibacillus sp. HB172176 TaxID=2493690 RepID=UPI001438961C|nr:response regulator transcription factor [Paenibacillus sp. HB172176]
MISIVLADDQTLMRDGLDTILSLQPDMQVVGMARDGEEALAMTLELKPDIVLMDIRMPGMDGIECTKQIKASQPGSVILILTTFADDGYIIDALAGGATGFLLKDIPGEKLAQAIRDAVKGDLLLPSSVASRLAARITSSDVSAQALVGASRLKAKGVKLSEKEKEIGRAMMEGKTNKEIASLLFMSEGTVKNYVSSVYAKLGTRDRTVAMMTLREMFEHP